LLGLELWRFLPMIGGPIGFRALEEAPEDNGGQHVEELKH
jgi:hypothetical protein